MAGASKKSFLPKFICKYVTEFISPCSGKPRLSCLNSSYDFAAKNISSPKEKIINHLLDTTSVVINRQIPESAMIRLHQWRYVEAESSPVENFFIDYKEKVAVCGDWFINSRVEGAFISANELSKEIVK